MKILTLSQIRLDLSPKVRATPNEAAIEEYAEEYRHKGHKMPQPVIFKVKSDFLVADGFHRVNAMLRAKIKEAFFDVREGSYQDCLKFALSANIQHGLRRTNDDKRASVFAALKEFSSLSNQTISEMVGVDHNLVSTCRYDMQKNGEIKTPDKVTGKDGKQYAVRSRIPPTEKSETPTNNDKPNDLYIEKRPEPVSKQSAEKEPDRVRDEEGCIVPERTLPFWNRRGEVKALIESLQQVKNEIVKAFKEEDLLYFGKGKLNQTITTDIEDVIRHLKSVLPYAVCPYCQGKTLDKCAYCNKTGVIDRNRYNAAPDNVLKMRRAAIEGSK